ncbi:MAG: carboxypeptidase-like regulatory domain-containing protein [Candidatus Sericytochromatia bacterium]|nr:carboxypeptidase-like regulatory domain-containing protein [Candidatus Sericytochromatia bacterium]
MAGGRVSVADHDLHRSHYGDARGRGLPPLPQRVRLEGLAELTGEAFGGARVRAVNLVTARTLGAEDAASTDARGRFTLTLPAGTPARLVRVVASRAGQALTTVVDVRSGRAIQAVAGGGSLIGDRGSGVIANDGGSLAAGRGYGLTQGAGEVALSLRLGVATTVATQALAGALKVQLRTEAPGQLDRALEVASGAARAVAVALEPAPALAPRLLATVGAEGQLQDPAAFRQGLADLCRSRRPCSRPCTRCWWWRPASPRRPRARPCPWLRRTSPSAR